MEITDFCFLGHAVLGPRIISKIEQKGVINKTHKNGDNINLVYFVHKYSSKNIYEIECAGKDSAWGKHILSTRTNITVDGFQKFLKDLSEVFIPEESKKRIKKKFTKEQTQKIIDLYKIGTSIKEIADKFPNRDYKAIYNRIQYLKHSGALPSNVQEKEVQKQKEECEQKPTWSEEDEMLMDELESYVLFNEDFNNDQKVWRIKRLKSFKEKIKGE